jgi:hypothetical protein
MLAAMSNPIAPHHSTNPASARGHAPPGARLAGWLLVPFALVVACIVCLALSACALGEGGHSAAAEDASAAPSSPPASTPPPRHVCATRVIEGIQLADCSMPGSAPRDHMFSRDEKAVAAASEALDAALQRIVLASAAPGALRSPGAPFTPAFAEWYGGIIAEAEPEERPVSAHLGPVGLLQRRPYDGAAIGGGDGAVVVVKTCWTLRYRAGLASPRQREVEAQVTLTSPGGEPLRVAGWEAWRGEPFCPR